VPKFQKGSLKEEEIDSKGEKKKARGNTGARVRIEFNGGGQISGFNLGRKCQHGKGGEVECGGSTA